MKGHEIINHLLREEMPDIEKVRENCHRHFAMQSTGTPKIKRLIPIVAALLMIFAISITTLAALGGFEFFIRHTDPPFAEIIEPIMNCVEDQGIRITLLGAKRFENTAIIYLSVQDISGENRLTVSTCVAGSPGMPRENRMQIYMGNNALLNYGMNSDHYYFDEISNTKYIQFMIRADDYLLDELTLKINNVVLERRELCEETFVFDEDKVYGEWSVTAHLEYEENLLDTAANELSIENLVFDVSGIHFAVESITINPISLQIKGRMTYNPDEMQDVYSQSEFSLNQPVPKTDYEMRRFLSNIYIEAAGEIISLNRGSGGGSGGHGSRDFDNIFFTEAPLDLSAVTAIIINDQRIPMS